MKLEYSHTLIQSKNSFDGKIQATSFSGIDDNYLAVATRDCMIYIYDVTNGDVIDSFRLTSSGMMRGLEFDKYAANEKSANKVEAKLVVAQENILLVYKWAQTSRKLSKLKSKRYLFSAKKMICNKFEENSTFTCVSWHRMHDIVYGLMDGSVVKGSLRSNKSQVLFHSNSYMTATAFNGSGSTFVSSHADGSLYKCKFGNDKNHSYSLLLNHSSLVYAMSWGNSICFGDVSGKINFLDEDGNNEFSFDCSSNLNLEKARTKEISAASFHPSGNVVVIGIYDVLQVFELCQGKWKRTQEIKPANIYRITSLSWSSNGSALVMGTCTGLLDRYCCFLRSMTYKNNFEVTQTLQNEVLIKACNGKVARLHSSMGKMITKLNFHRDPLMKHNRYAIVHTDKSLMCIDLDEMEKGICEIEWNTDEVEKFFFDAPSAFVIQRSEEIIIVEYGCKEVTASIKTEFISSSILSIRINENVNETEAVKFVAYLIDKETVCIKDLVTSTSIVLPHSYEIDFLELNLNGSLLLFRDKRRSLHLFDLKAQAQSNLICDCSYAQWVPRSNVVVAQSHTQMCVWYSPVFSPEFLCTDIDGDIESIERSPSITEVVVDNGSSIRSHKLNQHLVELSFTINTQDFRKSFQILDQVQFYPQKESMYRQLQQECIKTHNFLLAEQCATRSCEVGVAKYLRCLQKDFKKYSANIGHHTEFNFNIEVSLLKLQREIKDVEDSYLQVNRPRDAIGMYDELFMFPNTLSLLETNISEESNGTKKYFETLVATNQIITLTQLHVANGDWSKAINTLICSGMYTIVATLIMKNNLARNSMPTFEVERIVSYLLENKFFEEAGDIFSEILQQPKLSCDNYLKASAFEKAIDIAKNHSFGNIIELEEQFGDYSLRIGMLSEALYHYIQAHDHEKILDMALKTNDVISIEKIIESTSSASKDLMINELACHFCRYLYFDKAETYFRMIEYNKEIVDVYRREENWKQAHRIVQEAGTEITRKEVMVDLSIFLEKRGLLNEAAVHFESNNEKVFIYQRHRQFENALKLIITMKGECAIRLLESFFSLFVDEGDISSIERFLKVDESSSLLTFALKKLYENGLYVDSLRIISLIHGKVQGTGKFLKALLFDGFFHCPKSEEFDVLEHLNLAEEAIAFCLKNNQLEIALKVLQKCSNISPVTATKVRFEVALKKQDYEEAEEILTKQAPPEMRDMFWIRLKINEGNFSLSNGDISRMEKCFISINEPVRAIELLIEHNLLDKALIFASKYAPAMTSEIEDLLEEQCNNSDNLPFQKLIEPGGDNLASSPLNINASDEVIIDELNKLMTDKQFDEVIDYLLTLNIPFRQEIICIYLNVAIRILGRDSSFENKSTHQKSVSQLKKLLRMVINAEPRFLPPVFSKLLLATHFTEMIHLSSRYNLIDIATKCSITLIWFIDILPADKVYFLSASWCKKAGHIGLAFVLFNKYLDVCEAIDEKDLSIAHSNEIKAPFTTLKSLPSSHYITKENIRDETRDWILSISIDSKINRKLPSIEESRGTIYAGLFETMDERCLITGFPIEQYDKRVPVSNNHVKESDFNMFITNVGSHPWESSENLSLEKIPSFQCIDKCYHDSLEHL